jgi:hypothetical protein
MNTLNRGISFENMGAAGRAVVPGDTDSPREQAAEVLAREMDAAARACGRLAERLERVIESEKTRRRTAWSRGNRSRGDHMRLATG